MRSTTSLPTRDQRIADEFPLAPGGRVGHSPHRQPPSEPDSLASDYELATAEEDNQNIDDLTPKVDRPILFVPDSIAERIARKRSTSKREYTELTDTSTLKSWENCSRGLPAIAENSSDQIGTSITARRRSLRSSSILGTGFHCATDDPSEDNPSELDKIKKSNTRRSKTPSKQTELTDHALLDMCSRMSITNR